MQELGKPKPARGRPAGQTRANGYATSPGRPAAAKPDAYDQRLAAWRAWWPTRPRALTTTVLAERMEGAATARTIGAAGNGSFAPSDLLLGNLERMCSAYGYTPPTAHHQIL